MKVKGFDEELLTYPPVVKKPISDIKLFAYFSPIDTMKLMGEEVLKTLKECDFDPEFQRHLVDNTDYIIADPESAIEDMQDEGMGDEEVANIVTFAPFNNYISRVSLELLTRRHD